MFILSKFFLSVYRARVAKYEFRVGILILSDKIFVWLIQGSYCFKICFDTATL